MTKEEVKTSLDEATVTMKDIFKVLVEINTKLDVLINKNNTVSVPYTPVPITYPSTPLPITYEPTCESKTTTNFTMTKDNIDKINHKPNIQTVDLY